MKEVILKLLYKLSIKIFGSEFKNIHLQIARIFSLTGAYALSSFTGFLINLLAAKELGPKEFGTFSIAYATTTFIAVLGDFGVGASMIRFYNLYEGDKDKQAKLLSTSFTFVVFLASVLITLSPLLASFIAYFARSDTISLFTLSIVSGSIFILWIYLQNFLQAHRYFKILSLSIFAYSFLRLFTTFLFILLFRTIH